MLITAQLKFPTALLGAIQLSEQIRSSGLKITSEKNMRMLPIKKIMGFIN